jgi:hypothetical protein
MVTFAYYFSRFNRSSRIKIKEFVNKRVKKQDLPHYNHNYE